MRLSLTETGLRGAEALLDGMAMRGADLRPPLTEVADDFLDLESVQFRSEGARGPGGPWAQLAPSTVRQRGSAHPILKDTSDLFESLTTRGAVNSIRDVTSASAIVGTDDPKANFHQGGTKNSDGRRRMVSRKPVDPPPSDYDRWAEFIGRYLVP